MIERLVRDPSVDVDKLQRLLDIREQVAAREREDRYSEALTAAQAEMEPVRKDALSGVSNKKFSSLAEIDQAIRPIYTRHGFSVSFNTNEHPDPLQIWIVMDLRHKAGHVVQYHVPMPRDGMGPRGQPAQSKTHATGSAISYGRRYLLSSAFHIISADDMDDDGVAASGRRFAPARPAPNVLPPHDPVTGEIHEPPQGAHTPPAAQGAPVARSDSAGAPDPRPLTMDAVRFQLEKAAQEGYDALKDAFEALSSDWRRTLSGKPYLDHLKKTALNVDAERKAMTAAGMGDETWDDEAVNPLSAG